MGFYSLIPNFDLRFDMAFCPRIIEKLDDELLS
jgi:hypothetical protein